MIYRQQLSSKRLLGSSLWFNIRFKNFFLFQLIVFHILTTHMFFFQVLLASKVEISMSEELSELVSRERGEWR